MEDSIRLAFFFFVFSSFSLSPGFFTLTFADCESLESVLVLDPCWSLELALVGFEGTLAVLIAGLEEFTGPGLCLMAIMFALGAGGKAGVDVVELVG